MEQQEIWTILKILSWTKEYLLSKGVTNARLESEWLLCSVLGLDRVGLYLQYDKPLNDRELAAFRAIITRRGRREPLQHILGSQDFCGLDFEVTPDVLVPRYDTELLVAEAVLRCSEARTALDVGTGSGCVAVSLQKQLKNTVVTAIDISEAALIVARRNAEKNDAPVEYLLGSLFAPVAGRCFDLIVSNPPYIPSADIDSLEPEVREYDPRTALDGGVDGLAIYRALVPASVAHLSPAGWLFVEVGIGQSGDVVCLFQETGSFREPVVARDIAGIERVIGAQLREAP